VTLNEIINIAFELETVENRLKYLLYILCYPLLLHLGDYVLYDCSEDVNIFKIFDVLKHHDVQNSFHIWFILSDYQS
jgi:hypothetical protein